MKSIALLIVVLTGGLWIADLIVRRQLKRAMRGDPEIPHDPEAGRSFGYYVSIGKIPPPAINVFPCQCMHCTQKRRYQEEDDAAGR